MREGSKPNSENQLNHQAVGSRILIAEDERLIAVTLKDMLEDNGHIVTEIVDTAEDALESVRTKSTDILILDIRLSGSVDGIQAAILLHEKIKKIPILFLTAHSADQYPHLALLDHSLFIYLTKPYGNIELLSAIRKLQDKVEPPK
jgi:DNA-binding response OmpR family regulator